MTRNKMLALMVNAVHSEEYTNDFCLHFADLILKAQEQAGMLPPNVAGDTMAECGNFWEDENEAE